MGDTLTTEQRSARMARVRSKDTGPEMTVRRLVHGMGFRYRLHVRTLPGIPDMVFRRLNKVIFVHGCFWHRHPKASCKLARMPKSRLDFWKPKLEANRARDVKNQRLLKKQGWRVLEVWECELKNREALTARVRYFLEDEVT